MSRLQQGKSKGRINLQQVQSVNLSQNKDSTMNSNILFSN